eukprot:757542-Hanusia_phi.AAC.2
MVQEEFEHMVRHLLEIKCKVNLLFLDSSDDLSVCIKAGCIVCKKIQVNLPGLLRDLTLATLGNIGANGAGKDVAPGLRWHISRERTGEFVEVESRTDQSDRA